MISLNRPPIWHVTIKSIAFLRVDCRTQRLINQLVGRATCCTVDGRNPAPGDRWFILLFHGFQQFQVVQDFFHAQYFHELPSLMTDFVTHCQANLLIFYHDEVWTNQIWPSQALKSYYIFFAYVCMYICIYIYMYIYINI